MIQTTTAASSVASAQGTQERNIPDRANFIGQGVACLRQPEPQPNGTGRAGHCTATKRDWHLVPIPEGRAVDIRVVAPARPTVASAAPAAISAVKLAPM